MGALLYRRHLTSGNPQQNIETLMFVWLFCSRQLVCTRVASQRNITFRLDLPQ